MPSLMTFSRSRAPILYDYFISSAKISRVFYDIVDLGFRLFSNFGPSSHIAMKER